MPDKPLPEIDPPGSPCEQPDTPGNQAAGSSGAGAGGSGKTKRRGAVIIAAVLLVLIGGPVSAFLYLTHIPDTSNPRTVTDTNKIVSIDLPAGWFDDTREDAGEISTEGTSDVTQAYRVPDIEASKDLLDRDQPSRYYCGLAVTIGIPAHGTPHRAQHQMQVTSASDKYEVTPGQAIAVQIAGFPALTTMATSPADDGSPASTLILTTILTDDYLIAIQGYTSLPEDLGGRSLQQLISQAHVSDGEK